MLTPEEADEVMKSRPTRLPHVLLTSPHEAAPPFHADWTIVPDSWSDPEAWEKELRLRHARNKMIRDYLSEGYPVFYCSSGDSMWPMVQSGDGCLFHPIQAVTAADGVHTVLKEESEIGKGDIVFCIVQPTQQYYAHIVLDKEWAWYDKEYKYWLGNIQGHFNGWCLRQHIFGILVDVEVWWDGDYHSRPLPKTVFAEVQPLVQEDRWNSAAAKFCEPRWETQPCGDS